MKSIFNDFIDLQPDIQKEIHILLCGEFLTQWAEYCSHNKKIKYIETVCGTKQIVDKELLKDALNAVTQNDDLNNVNLRFGEPIAALQDDDLSFPIEITYGYYAVYNTFQKYIMKRQIDPWLIMNQVISALENKTDIFELINTTIDKYKNL